MSSRARGADPRRARRRCLLAAVGAVGAFGWGGVAEAQLAERVRAASDGAVRFAYETRPGVVVCDHGVRIGERGVHWEGRDGSDDRSCRAGAEVELVVDGGTVSEVALVRRVDERDPDAVDLGTVPAADVAAFLLSLPYRGAPRRSADEAILAAVIADVDDVWTTLLGLARDRSLHESVRKTALFWLGQEAADAVTSELTDVAMDDTEEQEVRNSAVFALSQRPEDEAIPALMRVALEGEQSETRRTAMFWLAQSDDPRVVRFFEEILLGRIR